MLAIAGCVRAQMSFFDGSKICQMSDRHFLPNSVFLPSGASGDTLTTYHQFSHEIVLIF
jgi:hypothetical protein